MKKKALRRTALILCSLVSLLILTVLTFLVFIPAGEIHADTSSPLSRTWMSEIPDNTLLSDISIPGTHNSAANFVQLGYFTKCQWDSVSSQLKEGYRLLDIRLGIYDEELVLVHDVFLCRERFDLWSSPLTCRSVIDTCLTFLEENPSETILFIAKRDSADSVADVQTLLDALISENEEKWLLTDRMPAIKEARGKIVLLRRYNDEASLGKRSGLDLSWKDQGASPSSGTYAEVNKADSFSFFVQDRYTLNVSEKWSAFTQTLDMDTHFKNPLILNYLSSTGPSNHGHPYYYAYRLNQQLLALDLSDMAPQWVLMDFGTENLAAHIYASNLSAPLENAISAPINQDTVSAEGTDVLRLVLGYLSQNAVLLFMWITLFAILILHPIVGAEKATPILITLVEIFVLTIVDYLEIQLSYGSEPSIWRKIFSVIGYSLRPAISYSLLFMVIRNKKVHWILRLLLLVNLLIYMTTFWSGIAFTYTEENGFDRGPLGYASHIVSFICIALVFYGAIRYIERKDSRNGIVLLLCALGAVGAAVIETLGTLGHILNTVIVIDCAFYYIYMYLQLTSRDVITGLFNRQQYYIDTIRFSSSLSGIIAIDMNQLKEINDTKGHQAGDAGLAAIGSCIDRLTNRSIHGYRIGGDEFLMLCCGMNESQVQDIQTTLLDLVQRAGYSISIGYAMKEKDDSSESVLKRADQAMYESKKEYYRTSGRDRRARS